MIRFPSTPRALRDRLKNHSRRAPMAEALEGRPLLAPFVFDPDGTGSLPATQVAGFLFNTGNALADNAVPVSVGNTFQLYYQSSLAGLTDINGNNVIPQGLGAPGSPGTTFEITAVVSFTERVVTLTPDGAVASFALAPAQAANSFIRLYYDNTPDSDALAGTGYNDGVLIYSASPDSSEPNTGSFTVARDPNNPANPAIDQFDRFPRPTDNDYPNTLSVTGSGAAALAGETVTVNPDFIKTPNVNGILFGAQTETPFTRTDPSRRFFNGTTTFPADVGVINGAPQGRPTDFQFQTLANANLLIPGIDIEKATNGQDADTAPGPLLTVGSTATFTYVVRNTGDDELTNVVVVDDNGTPSNSADDFNPTPVTSGGFNVGDTDHDNRLDPAERWQYRATRTVTLGQYTNIGTVTAIDETLGTRVTDRDASNHNGVLPPRVEGRMTGGGSVIDVDDDGAGPDVNYGRVTYGFELHTDPRIGPNSFEINWGGPGRGSNADPGQDWHLETLVSAQGIDTAIDQGGQAKNSPIDTYVGVGLGRLNGVSGYPAVWTIIDAGEPGSNDIMTITIYDKSDPSKILLSVSDTISGGNHQSHAENKSPTLTPPPLSSLPTVITNEYLAQLVAGATGTTLQRRRANTQS
jgi:hypothetical protein